MDAYFLETDKKHLCFQKYPGRHEFPPYINLRSMSNQEFKCASVKVKLVTLRDSDYPLLLPKLRCKLNLNFYLPHPQVEHIS